MMWVDGAFRWLVGIAWRFVRFTREVDRGIAVGRGYAPVGKSTRTGSIASRNRGVDGCEARAARGRARAPCPGRGGAGGRA